MVPAVWRIDTMPASVVCSLVSWSIHHVVSLRFERTSRFSVTVGCSLRCRLTYAVRMRLVVVVVVVVAFRQSRLPSAMDSIHRMHNPMTRYCATRGTDVVASGSESGSEHRACGNYHSSVRCKPLDVPVSPIGNSLLILSLQRSMLDDSAVVLCNGMCRD